MQIAPLRLMTSFTSSAGILVVGALLVACGGSPTEPVDGSPTTTTASAPDRAHDVTNAPQAIDSAHVPHSSSAAGVAPSLPQPGADAPRATTRVTFAIVLDKRSEEPALRWDPAHAAATSNFSTSIDIDDSAGRPHTLSVYFRSTIANAWDYHVIAALPVRTVAGPTSREQEIGSGTLWFDPSGALQLVVTNQAIDVDLDGTARDRRIELSFGTAITAGGHGLDGVVELEAPTTVVAQWHDGIAAPVPPR